jgi:ATP-binding protein involved in chromosome partitioning
MPLPVSVEGRNRPTVRLTWEDGHVTVFDAAELRRRCHCAYCIEEMTGQPRLDPTTVPQDLVCTGIELLGSYALAMAFSDGHQTGIYQFRDLRDWCPCNICKGPRPASAS